MKRSGAPLTTTTTTTTTSVDNVGDNGGGTGVKEIRGPLGDEHERREGVNVEQVLRGLELPTGSISK